MEDGINSIDEPGKPAGFSSHGGEMKLCKDDAVAKIMTMLQHGNQESSEEDYIQTKEAKDIVKCEAFPG